MSAARQTAAAIGATLVSIANPGRPSSAMAIALARVERAGVHAAVALRKRNARRMLRLRWTIYQALEVNGRLPAGLEDLDAAGLCRHCAAELATIIENRRAYPRGFDLSRFLNLTEAHLALRFLRRHDARLAAETEAA